MEKAAIHIAQVGLVGSPVEDFQDTDATDDFEALGPGKAAGCAFVYKDQAGGDFIRKNNCADFSGEAGSPHRFIDAGPVA